MTEREKKLVETQSKYIELLEKALSETHQIAAIHHYKASESDIEKGKALRNLIAVYSK